MLVGKVVLCQPPPFLYKDRGTPPLSKRELRFLCEVKTHFENYNFLEVIVSYLVYIYMGDVLGYLNLFNILAFGQRRLYVHHIIIKNISNII